MPSCCGSTSLLPVLAVAGLAAAGFCGYGYLAGECPMCTDKAGAAVVSTVSTAAPTDPCEGSKPCPDAATEPVAHTEECAEGGCTDGSEGCPDSGRCCGGAEEEQPAPTSDGGR
jgi:hypothetical protein